jgi:sialate O-acetylesterase
MKLTALLLLPLLPALAQTIAIQSGAVPGQVFQRGADGKADVSLSGTATEADGRALIVKLSRGIVPVFGFASKRMGAVENGKWAVTLTGVPAGGPYKLEIRVDKSKAYAELDDLYVGDIWVLAGQSNMEGVGNLENVQPPHPRVRMFDMVEEKWMQATEPLHNLPGSMDKVHWRLNDQKQPERYTGARLAEYNTNRKKGAGLGLAFGSAYEKHSGVPVALLPCAHGGTSMDQWDPGRWDRNDPGASLYGSMMRRVGAIGGKVKGVLWYQGESDANPKAAPVYREKFERLIARIRTDLNSPSLPFYYVQIGRHISSASVEPWNQVQEAERLLEQSVANTAVFAALDSDLDDGIHVSTPDLKRLGFNMAAFAAGKAKRGPRLVSAAVEGQVIRLRFTEVNGKLTSAGRISGFSVINAANEVVPVVYKAEIGTTGEASVLLHFQGKLPEGATIHYGRGKDPYCNLRDEMGFGLVAFGPIPLR